MVKNFFFACKDFLQISEIYGFVQIPVFETALITKETTYTLEFRKYFVVSFWRLSIRAFSVFLEDILRIISEP
jgi:hypothetical protein